MKILPACLAFALCLGAARAADCGRDALGTSRIVEIGTEGGLAVGFKTVRPHLRYPRLRLELKSAVTWREDVEVAIERLLGSVKPEPVLWPA